MTKHKTFIIAEMACSHEGDIKLAKKIIDAAFEANADAIQLQVWSLKNLMSPKRKEFELLKKIEFSRDDWMHLVDYCKTKYPRMLVYVCAYEHSIVEFIDKLGVDGYKLNSSDLSNPLILDKVALTGKPINLSIGASSIREIHAAVEKINIRIQNKITLMYGHQSFPTHPQNVNLAYMQKLGSLFDLPIGYQDHCNASDDSAFWLPAASMGMNVTVIEKHLTHDRSFKGIDHESALNPDEFVKFVKMIRIIDQAKGIAVPRNFSDDENKYREFQKKSIVVNADMKRGEKLRDNNLSFLRADTLGIPPDKIGLVLGRTLKIDIN